MNGMDQHSKQLCVLVLGMHRSGTSALTRCLNLLGMDLGSHLLSPEKGNAKGFWEHADVVRINDALLQSFGMYWHSLDPLPQNWLQSEASEKAREEIRELIRRDFAGVSLWGLKDPRMCRLAPLWLGVLREMGITVAAVFVVRSPLEVAASLEREHGLSISSNVISWMQHLAEAEIATRSIARTMVDYDHLLADPFALLSGIGHALGIVWPITVDARRDAIVSFLDVGLRTHRQQITEDAVPLLVSSMVDACERIIAAKESNDWSKLSVLSDEVVHFTQLRAYLNALQEVPASVSNAESHQAQGQIEGVHAALYYAIDDESFSEQQVVRREVPVGRSHQEFNLPHADHAPYHFRLDPADRRGCYILHSLMLLDSASKVIWNTTKLIDEVGLVGFECIESFTRPEHQLLLAGDDPQIVLPLPSTLPLSGVVLRLDIERLADSEICDELEAMQLRFKQKEELLASQLHEADKKYAFAVLERESDIADCRQQMDELVLEHQGEIANFQQKLDELALEHRGMLAVLESSQKEVARLGAAQVIQMQELDAIHASFIWRVLLRVRAVLSHMPEGMRRQLRRALKVAWWALTPWRIPARLRFRRQKKARLKPYPANQLKKKVHAIDSTVWEARGDDPFFYLAYGDDLSVDLPGGWYFLDISIKQRSGSLVSPKFYPDYGVGISEVFSLSLEQICTPRGINGLIRFDNYVRQLRFDPSAEQCEFSLEDISLRRLSKFGAAVYIYRTLVRRKHDPVKLAGRLFREFRNGGMRRVGDCLYGEYIQRGKVASTYYGEWVKQNDSIGIHDWKVMRRASRTLPSQPLISIVMPVYNTPEVWLRRCIDSVLRQAYPNWELCIADDASPMSHVKKILKQYATRDSRIKVAYRDSNGHISEASNSAVALARGEWIALLDHDDELPTHALYMIAKAINERPDAQLIYSDEDKIDEKGRRFDPYFKPDWNPDLFYSQNMISHLGAYKTKLVREVGGFRKGYEGSQDYDLALRCVERLHPEQIVHIPRVLYHWRAIPGSTALQKSEKNYAVVAGARALEDHFVRTGVSGIEVQVVEHGYRVKRSIAIDKQPKVSLIIPTRDRVELLRMCVDSILRKTEYINYEIVVVDNQSIEPATHAYFEQLRKEPKVRIFSYDAPFNYSDMNNVAVASTHSEIVGLVNNDIEVIHGDWLHEMISQVTRPGVGVVGSKLYYPDDTIQHAGVVLGVGGVAAHPFVGMPREFGGEKSRAALVQNFSAVTAACLLVRRDVFDAVGGLDSRLEVAFNDVDFCLRVRELGLRNVWTPYAELYHHESASRGVEDTTEKQMRFMREVVFMTERWGDKLHHDPAYNPNLTLDTADFALAALPRVARLSEIALGKALLLHK